MEHPDDSVQLDLIDDNPDNESVIATSKSQLKKLRRHQRWIEGREERKRLEKEKRRTKRRLLAKQREESNLGLVSYNRITLMKDSTNPFKIVIDLDFEDFMTDGEIGKCVKQVGRIYACNRHSQSPCQLYLSSLKGKIKDRFAITNRGYENWDINSSELDFMQVFKRSEDLDSNQSKEESKYIYLTGDTDQILPDVETVHRDYKDRVFIIGGLVDHNRHKKLCYERAQAKGITTARLPIQEHLKLKQRQILSTVTVFEILMEVLGYRKEWAEALLNKIPKRKIMEPLVRGPSVDLDS